MNADAKGFLEWYDRATKAAPKVEQSEAGKLLEQANELPLEQATGEERARLLEEYDRLVEAAEKLLEAEGKLKRSKRQDWKVYR